ncbi:DUF599 domain-containing protein [Pelagibacterium xiamenense]|uniref:DUF599 domain-containing protein n=1 Tax=Pelagibacterium xiamenense TaxID=2901140 RepID=UPI001E43C137|nr:DUF599 domain-containing protein [Pelagibacterium xiamenense]MCD7060737.1 DUF599 domain-containing protein [Pelagibacterium xiamenense]
MNAIALAASLFPLLALYLYQHAARIIDARRPSLSMLMNEQRFNWVTQATRRESPLDGILSGNIMSAVSFFASTTALLILALFTVIGQLPQFAPALSTVTFGFSYSVADLQVHNIVMLVLFVSAFLSFTLSLRQFNHFCILVGGLDHTRPSPPEEVRVIARINAKAAQSFNAGIRAYYFAIPMVAWYVSAWVALVVTVGTVGFLIHREYFSDARWLVAQITPH